MTNTDIAAPMAATTAKGRFSGAQQKLLAFGTLIILVIGFSLASPNFMQTSNILAILQATSVNGILPKRCPISSVFSSWTNRPQL